MHPGVYNMVKFDMLNPNLTSKITKNLNQSQTHRKNRLSNNSTNSESDINLFSVPDFRTFSGSTVEDLDNHISNNRISDVDLVVLQCKTNI